MTNITLLNVDTLRYGCECPYGASIVPSALTVSHFIKKTFLFPYHCTKLFIDPIKKTFLYRGHSSPIVVNKVLSQNGRDRTNGAHAQF